MATRAIVTARRGAREGYAKALEHTEPCRAKCKECTNEVERVLGKFVSLKLLYFWGAAIFLGTAALLFVLGLGIPPAMADALSQELRASVISTSKIPRATALTGGKEVHEKCESRRFLVCHAPQRKAATQAPRRSLPGDGVH